jgi:hypothetical protein
MAAFEYTELQGNEVILRAVEYLRMLPEWKAKPAKLRTGHVEFCEVIARHLVNLYCQLEGKPLTEKIELNDTANPLIQEKQHEAARVQDRAALDGFTRQLNEWHLELAIVQKGLNLVLNSQQLEDDEELSSVGYVLKHRLHDLVESCPFPMAADK